MPLNAARAMLGALTIVTLAAPVGRAADRLDLDELLMLADAFEERGDPERAIATLTQFQPRFQARPAYWRRLVRLREATGDLAGALEVLERAGQLAGAPTIADVVQQASLLWRLQRPADACARLVAAQSRASVRDQQYWVLLGDLAWNLEKDDLAVRAWLMLWRGEKTPDLADQLIVGLAARRDDRTKLEVAEAAAARFGPAHYLLTALEAAVQTKSWDKARALGQWAQREEAQFAGGAQYWQLRALLADHEDQPREAEGHLARALALDPTSSETHQQWLSLAARHRDVQMLRRALAHWGPEAATRAGAWDELATAHELMDEPAEARRFRELARDHRAARTGQRFTPDEAVTEAVRRHDRPALEGALRGSEITLGSRLAALRELGREDEAWSLLVSSGLTHTRASTVAIDEAGLSVEDVDELRGERLEGVRVWGETRSLGGVDLHGAGGRLELRRGRLLAGVEAGATRLSAPEGSPLLSQGSDELHGGLLATWRTRLGETSARVALQLLPGARVWQGALGQTVSLGDGAIELRGQGVLNELPTHSALLRVGAVRSGLDAELTLRLPWRLELASQVTTSRFATHQGELITSDQSGRLELAARLSLGGASIRPRADVFRVWAPRVDAAPPGLRPFLGGITRASNLIPLAHSTAGGGITISSKAGEVGEARGRGLGLRYTVDAWTGALWPARKATYALDAALGVVFARDQELAVGGFFYSDVSGTGERFAGASLKYSLRWLR
jgi:tetratricopeptide (TPR) repeat protein